MFDADTRPVQASEPAPTATPSPTPLTDRRERLAFAGLIVVFVVSRVIYYALGVRFYSAGELQYMPQILAPDLLRHHLLQSIWYLHAQPPLFNLMIGAVLKWSPLAQGFTFQVIFFLTGLALMLGLYDLARQLTLGRRTAFVLAVVVGCAPAVVMWENVLNYDYFVAAFLVWIADATARWVRGGNAGALAAVSALGAATVLLRSLMHPVFYVLLLAILLLLRPPRWTRRVVAAIAIPALLVGGVMLKNEIIFGSPELSNWLGYNLRLIAISSLPDHVQADLRARGVIKAPDFPPPCKVSHPDVPALAQEWKTGVAGQVYNENWDCMRKFRADLVSDSVAAAKAEPGWLLRTTIGSAETWAAPSELYWETAQNERKIDGIDRAYRTVVMGDVHWSPPVDPRVVPWAEVFLKPDKHWHLSITIVVATLLAIGGGVVALVRFRRHRTPALAAYIMGAFIVLFADVVSIVLSHNENARLRFIAEPLTLVLALAAVVEGARWYSARRARTSQVAAAAE